MNGGAIALGLPVGTSGARTSYSLAVELNERNVKYRLASLCRWWARNCSIIGKTLEYKLYWSNTQYENEKRKAAPGGCFLCGRVCQFKISVKFTPIIEMLLFCRIK
ncbi:hypothetical protein [Cytobacillus firmus]|uniref:hypothetical protein n=1 Tax=Cytobacillus firmus TaxID=1399 RepID=UPI001EBC1DF1|nr:hypothetical protein [Cytobacillus firmus]